jgi:D-Tyr-tRNAtyr deacylase
VRYKNSNAQNLRNEQRTLKEKIEDYKDKLSCAEKQKSSLKQVLVKYVSVSYAVLSSEVKSGNRKIFSSLRRSGNGKHGNVIFII